MNPRGLVLPLATGAKDSSSWQSTRAEFTGSRINQNDVWPCGGSSGVCVVGGGGEAFFKSPSLDTSQHNRSPWLGVEMRRNPWVPGRRRRRRSDGVSSDVKHQQIQLAFDSGLL